ncbi:MAG: hypothetical protein JKY51_10010, partial [Opitutaceae bacterium]|nr:hypothetical protein [Opitutaceae bacterium]
AWVGKVVDTFDLPHHFNIVDSDLIDGDVLINFGDALRIHHSFSVDPFSKDKFEYVLETVLNMSGHKAALATKGNRGHDITINGETVSLKTQADKSIRTDKIWISKFMELGAGEWGDNPEDLIKLRESFLRHLKGYDRIFTLRTLKRAPDWFYELVEIPKSLLLTAEHGELVMMMNSKQFPKPGYCYVPSKQNQKFQLYFDGGGERKLQIKHLLKNECRLHATWSFSIPNE